jgi:hypothetical protein
VITIQGEMTALWFPLGIIIFLFLLIAFNTLISKSAEEASPKSLTQVGGDGWPNECLPATEGPINLGYNADTFFLSPPDITASCQRYGSPYPDRSSLIAISNNNGDCSQPKVANLEKIIHPGKVDQTYYYNNPCLTKAPYGTKTAGLEYMMKLGELNNELYRNCDEYGCPSSNPFFKPPVKDLPLRDYAAGVSESASGVLGSQEWKRVRGEDKICPPLPAMSKICAYKPSTLVGTDAAVTAAHNDITEEMYHNPTLFCSKYPDHPRCAIFSGLFTPFVGPVIYTNKEGEAIGNGLPPMDKVFPLQQPPQTNADGFCLETNPFCRLDDTRGITILQSQMIDPRC